MTNTERLEEGRRCAYGLGQSPDPQQAFELWREVLPLLSDEDLEVYAFLQEIYGARIVGNSEHNQAVIRGTMIPALTKIAAAERTEEETVRLFEEALIKARELGSYNALYNALQRQVTPVVKREKVKSAEDVRFGNNLGHLIYAHWTSVLNFFNKKNDYRLAQGLKPKKTVQGVYQALAGEITMDDADRMIVVRMVNDIPVTRSGLKRPLTVNDLYLPISQYLDLYQKPKMDAKTRRLLEQERFTNAFLGG